MERVIEHATPSATTQSLGCATPLKCVGVSEVGRSSARLGAVSAVFGIGLEPRPVSTLR